MCISIIIILELFLLLRENTTKWLTMFVFSLLPSWKWSLSVTIRIKAAKFNWIGLMMLTYSKLIVWWRLNMLNFWLALSKKVKVGFRNKRLWITGVGKLNCNRCWISILTTGPLILFFVCRIKNYLLQLLKGLSFYCLGVVDCDY